MSKILGISPGGFLHDSSACIVINGKLVAAAEEERFNRDKHTSAFPLNAINFCLQYAGLQIEELDNIAISWLPKTVWHHQLALFLKHRDLAHALSTLGSLSPRIKLQFRNRFRQHFSNFPSIVYFEHHRAHAATAFYCSGFSRSSIVTIDGNGENNSTVSWFGEGNRIKKLRQESDANSLGNFYKLVTSYIGLHRSGKESGEGKTMGLASYGSNDDFIAEGMKKIIDVENAKWYSIAKKFRLMMEPNDEKAMRLVSKVFNHPPRLKTKSFPLEYPYAQIAWSAQKSLEEALLKVVEYTMDTTGCDNLCLSGGVALNCTANMVIKQNLPVRKFFIFPGANDGGTSIGAALALSNKLGEKVNSEMQHVYWGPEYSNESIEKLLKERKLLFDYYDDISGVCAELISKGNVIGWVQGRMELGPRTLGSRSILADPRNPEMKKIVNESVKKRELWRPFCPSMLDEAKDEYLEDACYAPFMILNFKVNERKTKEIPAVVHVDGTTRPQTVRREINEKYWKLIKAFETETSVPMVLNTSFNLAGEPIVCTPRDAIKTFFDSGMDYLALGNFLVKKSNHHQ